MEHPAISQLSIRSQNGGEGKKMVGKWQRAEARKLHHSVAYKNKRNQLHVPVMFKRGEGPAVLC